MDPNLCSILNFRSERELLCHGGLHVGLIIVSHPSSFSFAQLARTLLPRIDWSAPADDLQPAFHKASPI